MANSENTTGTPTLDDLRNVVTIYTDMVVLEKEKKKNASIPYADRVANRTPEGELRRGTTTYRTPDARTAILRLFNSINIAELGDDLVINTLKYSGSRAKRLKLAPNDESSNVHIERFEFFFSEELGTPAKFLWFKDFNEVGGGLHFHVLISRPKDFDAASFDRLVRDCWARATGQEFDRSGVNAWTPKVTEVWYGDTAAKTFKNFVRYEAQKFNPETGKFEKKVAQKRVDKAWLDSDNYRVKWAGISTALLPTEPLKLKLTCACGNSDVRAVMQEHSPAARNIVTFDCREVEGAKVDIDLGRWSFDLMGKGVTEFIKVTPELIEALRAVEEAHAGCSAPAPVEEVTVSPVAVKEAPVAPAATEQVLTPAEAQPASSASITITKESTMEDVNAALEGMFNTDAQDELEAAAKESFIMSFPVISIEQRHAELAAVKADPTLTYAERDRLVRIASDLLNSTITTIVSEEMTVTDEDMIALRAEKVTLRFEPLVPHLSEVKPEDAARFASLPLLDQFTSLTSQSEPVGATASFLLLMSEEDQQIADSFEAMHREAVNALQRSMHGTRSKASSAPENESDELLHDLYVEDAARYRGKVLDESTVTWRIGEVNDDGDGLGSVWMVAEGQWVDASAGIRQVAASL
ncbi:hypothetical protein ABIB17_000486 [Arthrobacter sp. UYEF6]